MSVIDRLTEVLEARRAEAPDASYVASLYARGLDRILEKVGEEATETIIAAKNVGADGGRERVVAETADLWFHAMVMLVALDIRPAEVLAELDRRFGRSGLEEKASRQDAS